VRGAWLANLTEKAGLACKAWAAAGAQRVNTED
jgi:hypothetical protein